MIQQSERLITYQVLGLTTVGIAVAYGAQFIFPTLAVTIARELRIPLTQVLSWSFGGFLLFGLGALPGGYLVERIGARRAMLVGMAGMGVSALAAAEAEPGRSLGICLACLGLFAGFPYPAAMTLLGALTPAARERGARTLLLAASLGLALAPAVANGLASHYGSRHSFSVLGFALCALAATLAMLRTEVDDLAAAPTVSPSWDRAERTRPPRAVQACATALTGLSFTVLALVLPAHLATRGSSFNFGYVTSIVYLVALGGWYVAELVTRSRDRGRLYLIVLALSLSMMLLLSRSSGTTLAVAATVAALCGFATRSIEVNQFAALTGPPRRALGHGARFALSAGFSSLAVPLTVETSMNGGLSTVFLSVAALLATAGIAAASFAALLNDRPARTAVEAKAVVSEPAV